MVRLAAAVLSVIALVTQPAAGPLFVPAPNSPFEVGHGSGGLIVADINRDGRADLLTRHLLTNRVVISLGQDSGRLVPAAPLAFEYQPGDMKLGDINEDGILDLAITPGRTDIVDLLTGDGRGTFSRAPGSPFTVSHAVDEFNKRTLHLVDLNEDGHLDVVVANGRRRNTIGTLFGDGRGAFRPGPAIAVESGRDRYWYAFGDLNGDRHLDVVTASNGRDEDRTPGRLLIKYGDGRGAFRDATSPFLLSAQAGVVTVGDVNRDGRLDVGVAHSDGGFSVLLNDGRGGLAHAPASPMRLPETAYALAFQDVNHDNRADVVAATVDSITILLGTPTGFVQAPGSPFPAGPGAYTFTFGDLNNDGTPDIVSSAFEGERVTILLGR